MTASKPKLRRLLLALDPGLDSTGWALRSADTGELLRSGALSVRALSDPQLVAVLDRLLGRRPVRWAAAIERPYNHRGPREAFRRLKLAVAALAKRRARRAGVTYRKPWLRLVYPQTWRSGVGIPTRPAEAAKAAAVKWAATDASPHELNSHDEAEAICVSNWAGMEKGESKQWLTV